MANINIPLPPAATAIFHPPTESLQQDNIIKPSIPQTNLIESSYHTQKDQSNGKYSSQKETIYQNEGSNEEEKDDTETIENKLLSLSSKRNFFFLTRNILDGAFIEEEKTLELDLIAKVIRLKYLRTVTPFIKPALHYFI